jgi:hypothetical protein
MKYDVLLVAAALDELAKESSVGSLDSAQIVVNAFHDLKPCDSVITEMSHTEQGGSTQGHTDLGNVTLNDKNREVTDVRGVNYTRVGKWKIWREVLKKKRNVSRIWFVHFLSQGIHDSVKDREFFVEYDENLTPKGFAYMDNLKQVFKFWFLTIYQMNSVVVFGEISSHVEKVSVSLKF